MLTIDKADQNLLSAVYLEVCRDLDAGPAFLGLVTLCRGVSQSLASVFSGPLGARFDRVKLCGAGCIFWGVATLAVGLARSHAQILVARAINGIGLGIVLPLAFALVADLSPLEVRGRAFGLLFFLNHLGAAASSYSAIEIAATAAGWRVDFYAAAAVSCVAGLLLYGLGCEPRRLPPGAATTRSFADDASDACRALRVRTFVIILLQARV